MSRRSEAIWISDKSYWMVKVQRQGVRKAFYSSLHGRKGKHEAESKADEWLELGLETMRFPQAWDEFIAAKRASTSRSNVLKLEWAGAHIKPVVASRRLDSITPLIWQDCINRGAKNSLTRRSCMNLRATIASFVAFCQRRRWQVQPLLRGDLMIPTFAAPEKEKQVLQPGDMQTLFSKSTITRYGREIPCHYIHAWRFLVATGLRRGELCGLRRDDVTAESVSVCRSINFLGETTRGKNDNARRTFALTQHARAILAEQAEMLRFLGIVSPWVFPDPNGDRTDPNALKKQWDCYRRQHGIASNLHELRHTFVSAMKADLPLELMKAVVGHSEDMDTIGVYGHEIDGDQQRAAQIIDTVFEKILP